MIKIITLANLQLFLTKCKTIFALKKHKHTAADITGLPSGGKPTTLYGDSAEAGGLYPVFKGGSKNASLFDWMGNLLMRTRNPDNGSGLEVYYGDGDSVNGSTPSTKAIVVNKSKGVSVLAPDGSEVINAKESEVNVKDINGNSRLKITPTNASVKYSGKGLDVSADKTSLSSAKEVRLESEAGSGASLRLSEKDVHLDGIDGGMMVESRESLSGEICYGMNLPLKNRSTDTNPTTQPIKGILLHKTYVELTGPDNSIYGDAIYLGAENSHIGVNAESFNFNSIYTDVQFNGYSIPSLFPNRAIPNIHSLLSQVTNAIISVPDKELTYGYMYDYSEEICVFHNESHTMYFLKDGDVIQPLSIPVFNSVEEALAVLDTDTQLLYAKNPNTGVFELMYNSGVSGSGFELVYLDESPQESVGYDKIVNITNALLKLKELSTK